MHSTAINGLPGAHLANNQTSTWSSQLLYATTQEGVIRGYKGIKRQQCSLRSDGNRPSLKEHYDADGIDQATAAWKMDKLLALDTDKLFR